MADPPPAGRANAASGMCLLHYLYPKVMNTNFIRAVLFAAALSAPGIPGAASAAATTLPLDTPALMTRLAPGGALLDLALAGERLVAVGERGHVVFSDDGGKTWTQAAVPVSATLTAVDFIDPKDGWAVGHAGVVLHTGDGGATWVRQTDGRAIAPELTTALRAAQAADDAALGDKLQRFIEDGPDKPLLDVLFLDARRGFAVGAYGLMLATDDGGEHWRVACDLLGGGEDRHIYAIRRVGDALWLAGEQGLLYRSTDDGQHFTRVEGPAETSWFGLAGSGDELILLGLRGALWRSGDAGGHWQQLPVDGKYSFVSALALKAGKGYLIADDGGGLWHLAPGASSVRRLDASARFPLASLARATDGDIVASGLAGTLRVATPGL